MRWDRLFLDLEHRFDREAEIELAAEAADEARARQAALTLADRLAQAGVAVVRTRVGATVRLQLEVIGADWIAGHEIEGAARLLIPMAAIEWARIEAAGVGPPPDRRGRIRLTHTLRELGRRRSAVEITLPTDRPTGTIDRVAEDHLDLAVHPLDEPRRPGAVSAVWLVPLGAIDRVRWWG